MLQNCCPAEKSALVKFVESRFARFCRHLAVWCIGPQGRKMVNFTSDKIQNGEWRQHWNCITSMFYIRNSEAPNPNSGPRYRYIAGFCRKFIEDITKDMLVSFFPDTL